MLNLHVENMRHGYVDLVNALITDGTRVAPRGQPTREIYPARIIVDDPRDAVPVGVRPKLYLPVGAAESVHALAGLSDSQQLINITPNFRYFVRGNRQPGAYGPRVADQWHNVIRRLASDSDTRQAAALIWRPDELDDETNPDVPCTISMHWMIRDNALHMFTSMRSNDVFLGVPYDFMMFTNVQVALAWALGLDVGRYFHTATSLHVYERDLEKLQNITVDETAERPPSFIDIPNDTRPGHMDAETAWSRWLRVRAWARRCVVDPGDPETLPDSVRWYYDTLAPFRSNNILCSSCHYVLPEEEFHLSRRFVWRSVCIECKSARVSPKISSRSGVGGTDSRWTTT